MLDALILLVQSRVAFNHVFADTLLADLLGSKLSRSIEISAVIVAEMVVRSDGNRFEALRGW